MIFIIPKVKYALGDLETKFILKMRYFYIFETDDTRRKRVSSLKMCRLQNQLVIGELGASCKTFSKYSDSSCGSAVPLRARFHNVFLDAMHLFVPRTRVPMFRNLLKKNTRTSIVIT